MKLTLPSHAALLSDEDWLRLLVQSTAQPSVEGIEFPQFPPEHIQRAYVGSANEHALREAFAFYQFVKQAAAKAGNPIRRGTRALDFGCGWGRFLRFFWKDVGEDNLHGCDISREMLDLCGELRVPGHLARIDPRGTLPYPDQHFDSILAFSVFTHLPEPVHLHWMRELARVAKPGCVFGLTLEPRRFLDFVRDLPAEPEGDWYRLLAAHQPRLAAHYKTFDSGNLVFLPTNPGVEEVYGDAVVPLKFIKRHWSPSFKVRTYVDDPRRFWQAAMVVQRTRR